MLTGGVNDRSGALHRLPEIPPGTVDRDEVINKWYGRDRKKNIVAMQHILLGHRMVRQAAVCLRFAATEVELPGSTSFFRRAQRRSPVITR